MKKKILSTVVAFTVVCSSFAPIQAFAGGSEDVLKRDVQPMATVSLNTDKQAEDGANAAIKKDEAKAISIKALKEYMDYELDERAFQSNVQYMRDYGLSGKYVWMISWNAYSAEKSTNINIGIDSETGKILSLSFYENANSQKPKGAMKTQKEARKIAEEFLKKINPLEYGQLEYVDDSMLQQMYGGYRDTTYSFRYIRKINGIPFENDSISVSVDGTNGKITGYNYSWNGDLSFPGAEAVIGAEKAIELYKKTTTFSLGYIGLRGDKNHGERITGTKLVYQPDFSAYSVVDAKTGTWVNWQGEASKNIVKTDLSSEERAAFLSNAKPREKLDEELDSEKATKLAETYIEDLYGSGYEVQSMNYSEGGRNWFESRGKNSWTAQFVSTDKTTINVNGGNLTINAETGEMLASYRYYSYDDATLRKPFTPSVTWEQGYKKAIELIKKYYGDKIVQIETAQIKPDSKSYYNGYDISNRLYTYTFPRIVNGIPFGENSVSVTIDSETGKINQAGSAWDESLSFSGKGKEITPEAAGTAYFNAYHPELSYMAAMKEDGTISSKVDLVYLLKNKNHMSYSMNIEAETGIVIGYDGLPITEEKNSFEGKIKGTKYERELTILAFQGIIDKTDFQMNRAINKGEFLKMLVNTNGQNFVGPNQEVPLKFTNVEKSSEYYSILQRAVTMGLVMNKEEKIDLKSTLSREEMADMIVKLLQLDKVAKAKGIFKLDYSDAGKIRASSFGSVALCKGLRVFEDAKQFRPKDKATMLEAALAVYRALAAVRP